MCWSMEASVALTAVGTAGLTTGIYRKQPKELLIPMGYFTLMEGIQALSYTVINACDAPLNQFLTILSFIHIAFQPFFINMVMMYFIPKERRRRIARSVYILSGIATIITLAQLYPFAWAGSCLEGIPLCGRPLCSVMGTWHLAWNIPLNGLTNFMSPMLFMGLPGYFAAGLLLPFLYGSWKANLYHIILGPLLAVLITQNLNEAGAIWCTLSIALLLSLLGGEYVRKYLRVGA